MRTHPGASADPRPSLPIILSQPHSTGTSGVNMHLERCQASRNDYGIYAEATSGTATVRVSNCIVTNNNNGVLAGTGGSIQSRGNNTLESNGSANTFPATYTAK